uniref:Uncharacterized protein n=1 Tax=Haptolina brevifila TaxID=156173 RepID=A0A7S2JBI1_9EUKA|mmetsp:Transcript_79293/g.157668  ORF Transcript_79293/g.157668 Transcript_79293/m.157668 type:complete len:181 (+) Transcript_79293:99-641(+)|eukprot:CAMPEP_0174703124 /NCGR_PEP_ID=MMETSP1094-20130205/7182_1 /TAXON_ID=156173 /ORGANISM="Chrysochromulina brevifilum, Strain UTEX LB 985" /LENGTH=180 /DNA_ID=CAMNT_0015901001 /DNA_START=87 /DNA_END=629 /DNA_ORIENTATION=-
MGGSDAVLGAVPFDPNSSATCGTSSGTTSGGSGSGTCSRGCSRCSVAQVQAVPMDNGKAMALLIETMCDLRSVYLRTGDHLMLRVVNKIRGHTAGATASSGPGARPPSLCANPLEADAVRRVRLQGGRRGSSHVMEVVGVGSLRASGWLAPNRGPSGHAAQPNVGDFDALRRPTLNPKAQ